MALTQVEALWFLPLVLPICFWAAWSDLKYMKIRNKSVVALFGIFAVVGLLALPFDVYLWRLVQGAVVLVLGILANMLRLLGAGDAKFAAGMALFVPAADAPAFFILLSVVMIAALVTHRLFRAIPAVRSQTADWVSWQSRKFPMGLALGGGLGIFLALGTVQGA